MSREIYRRSVAPHLDRIRYDGGAEPRDVQALIALQRYYEERKDSIKLLYCPALTGNKIRVSGANNYVSKCYDIGSLQNDATQSTAVNQPYLSGNIAPNERYCLKNANGGSNYMTHPTISFSASDAWSVTTVLNWNYTSDLYQSYCGDSSIGGDVFFRFLSENKISVYFGGLRYAFSSSNTLLFIGKNVIITLVYINTSFSLYVNGVFIQTVTASIAPKLDRLNVGFIDARIFKGQIKSHIIRSQALTATEVLNEATYLRTIYPEMGNVVIGTQTWTTSNYEAVCTPQGNLIQEMQAASNVEKLANINFTTNATWILTGGAWTIGGGAATMVANGSDASIYQTPVISVGKWHKITITVSTYISGSLYAIYLGIGNYFPINITAAGTYIYYVNAIGSSFVQVKALTFNGSLSQFSCQEVGWSDSQNLYTSIYDATSGTTEQKTYAAVKAAAMWCHYNNDVAVGEIYGKLYNWFAVKLLQMDIDYYNTANPTALWGWRVDVQTDATTLSTYLGGDSISGGKMKVAGTAYWGSPNSGADNSSGLSIIAGGQRLTDGTFSSLSSIQNIWTMTESVSNALVFYPYQSGATLFFENVAKSRGGYIRLIK